MSGTQGSTFVSADGERCPVREWLEVDHRQPRALGGDGTIENVRILCRGHNRLAAAQTFGAEHITCKIEEARAGRTAAAEHRAQPSLLDLPAETTSANPAMQAAASDPATANPDMATLTHDVNASTPAAGTDVIRTPYAVASAAAGTGVAGAPDASTHVAVASALAAGAGVVSALPAVFAVSAAWTIALAVRGAR
ncbi:MAG: HNH endonuclease [Labilithrix sp.]|nr:HNH endonuclease [Labilithrix sp.]MCW5816805.1 HNH endonuclease [Labilithrix sp.]